MKVFISGSISIKKLPTTAIEIINNYVENGLTIFIGDAFGVDLSIQKYLAASKYENIVIYYAGEIIRNNYGNWTTVNIKALNNEKNRELFVLKDKQMSIDADLGLMIWDGKSKGTLNNIRMMQVLGKPFKVIIDNIQIEDNKINHYIHPQK
ncbi:MAG: hypothetical protein ACOYMA_17390 [Bacteroidia bacterium]